MTTPIITLATVKDVLNIRETNVQHDTKLEMLRELATEDIQTFLGYELERSVRTETFNTRKTISVGHDLYGSSETGYIHRAHRQGFFLPGINLDEAEGIRVWYDPAMLFGDDTELTDGDDFYLDWSTRYLTIFRGMSEHTKALKVEFTAGIEAAGDPASLEDNAPSAFRVAAAFQTAYLFKRMREDNIGMEIERATATDRTNVQASRWNTTGNLCFEATSALAKYRQPFMGRG